MKIKGGGVLLDFFKKIDFFLFITYLYDIFIESERLERTYLTRAEGFTKTLRGGSPLFFQKIDFFFYQMKGMNV